MQAAQKLLVTASIGRSMVKSRKLQRMLPILITAAICAVAAAAVMGALAACSMYMAYTLLLQQGIGQAHALLATALGSGLIILALLAAFRQRLLELKSVAGNPVSDAADAFLDGLLGR